MATDVNCVGCLPPKPSMPVNTVDDFVTKKLSFMSFNMHGFNQGIHIVRDMIFSDKIDICLLQEHWLTPFNLYKFNDFFPGYMCFGSSAMGSVIETGVLRGRPYGGVMILVNNELHKCTHFVCSDDRYVIVVIGNLIVTNVYFPCVGSVDRLFIYEDVIEKNLLMLRKLP